MKGICIGHSTSKIIEYSTVVKLLFDVIAHGILHLVFILESQLILLQLANVYLLRSSTILLMVLRVCLLEIDFDFIQYEQISRNLNTLKDAIANHGLDENFNKCN